MATRQIDKTLTQGKRVEVANISTTASESNSYIFVNEAEALKLSCNVVSMKGSFYWELWEIGGDTVNHETLVHQSATMENASGTIVSSYIAGSKLRLDVYNTGSLTMELSAIGIPAAAVKDVIQAVRVEPTKESILHREELECILREMRDTLHKVNNHMRHITGIEQEEAGDF